MVLSAVPFSAPAAGFLVGDVTALVHNSAAFANDLGPIHAIVEYAAYAPGTFDVPGAVDPSGGTEYVYAYQLFNTGGAQDNTLSVLTIGVKNVNHWVDKSALAGLAPSGMPLLASSIRADFVAPEIGFGQNSDLLLYTSPLAPGFRPATVANGGVGDTQLVVAAVPEPATIGLLAMVTACGLLRRNRGKNA